MACKIGWQLPTWFRLLGIQVWMKTFREAQKALDHYEHWVGTDSQNESNRWRIWWILLPGETSSSTSSSSNLPSEAAFKMSCSSSQSPQTQTIKSIICWVWTPFGSHHVLQSSPEKPVHLELQQLQAFPAYNIGLQIHLQHPTTNARRTLLAAGNTSYFGHLSRTNL